MDLGEANDYNELARRDNRNLLSWIQWEAAQYCVDNRLRTPLGKPPDTFVSIENIIRKHAKILALKDQDTVNGYRAVMSNQKSARILLGFMEALEKAIYNASDGNAFGIPAPDKPARTFFRLNTQTCNEWFTRNRTAVDLIALHNMELEMVIRYSESVLKELVANEKTEERLFDHILMSLVWALLRNYESDALIGLYNWTRKVTGKKYLWIKMAADQAAGHREIAADGYNKLLKDDSFEPSLREFIIDQRNLSLYYSMRYVELKEMLEENEKNPTPRVTIPILDLKANQLDCSIIFDETHDIDEVMDHLSDWKQLDDTREVENNFSCHFILNKAGFTLGHAILKNKPLPDYCTNVIQSMLQECFRTGSKEYMNQIIIINYLISRCHRPEGNTATRDMKSIYVNKKYGTLALLIVLFYSEFFDEVSPEGEQQSIDLRLDVIQMARKETNYLLCKKWLEKTYSKIDEINSLGLPCLSGEFFNRIFLFLNSSKFLIFSQLKMDQSSAPSATI